jgi:hypothetical protein
VGERRLETMFSVFQRGFELSEELKVNINGKGPFKIRALHCFPVFINKYVHQK